MSAPWRSADGFVKQSDTMNRRLSTHPSSPELRKVITTRIICKDYDPATGNKMINQYMVIREIGRGMHGKVKLAEDTDTGEWVAIKIVDKRTRQRQHSYTLLRGPPPPQAQSSGKKSEMPIGEQKVRREIAILKKCAHPHVVRLKEVIDDPASNKIYMVLEFMDGGEVQWRNDDEQPLLSLDESRNLFRGVVSGLDYLHYQGIIHRDIKPANLLYSADGVVKISDFGVSYFHELLAGKHTGKTISEQPLSEQCNQVERELAETAGTPAFFAPELCYAGDDEEEGGLGPLRITHAIDVWALGVTLYCFIFGRCPFTANTEFELFDIIPTALLEFPGPIDPQLQDLLQKLLTKNPEERITLDQVKVHPWVVADLSNPSAWLEIADPTRYKTVEVTDDEVTHAVTIMDRVRRSIHKLSHSLANLAYPFTRRRSKSASPRIQPRRSSQQSIHLDVPTPTVPHDTQSGSAQIMQDNAPQVAELHESDVPSYEHTEEIASTNHPRPGVDRKGSSTSTVSSGLVISFTKHT